MPRKETIEKAVLDLEEAARGEDGGRIHARIEALDTASKEFATRRINRVVARAMEGRKLDEIEERVAGRAGAG